MLNLKIMTKFQYLYKRAYSFVFDKYCTLYKFLEPFLVRSGSEARVARFSIDGFGDVSLKFVRKTTSLSFRFVHIATSCNVYHEDSDFCLSFNDLREPSVTNLRKLVYLRSYFSYVYASLKVDYDLLCESLLHIEDLTVDRLPF